MKRLLDEGKLILIAIPVLIWTMLPIYHLFVLSISNQESMLAGKLWPDQPTLQNFQIVFKQQHYYLTNFWLQLFNSFLIAITTGLLTLFIATCARCGPRPGWCCSGTHCSKSWFLHENPW